MKRTFQFLVLYMSMFISLRSASAQKDSIPDYKYFPPVENGKNIALFLLGGSEGGLPTYYDINKYTSMGIPCFIAGYFGTKGTPEQLEMIPLEYLGDAITRFKSYPEVKGKKIIVMGGSKGGELALLLASVNMDIEGVIANVPASVVFQGISGKRASSWSYKGEQVPFVPYAPFDYSRITNSEYVEVYRLSLEQEDAVKKAAIRVERINGPVLILTGTDDTMWPSSQMGEMIVSRLKQHHFPLWYKHVFYEDAGHSLNETYMMGGTPEGNKKARLDSEKRIMDFLLMVSEK